MPADGENDVRLAHVRFVGNFALNLESIEAFWIENEFAAGYDRLLDALTDVMVPNLQRHPRIGRPFMSRAAASVEAQRLMERIDARLSALGQGAEIREYVLDDYLVLYLVSSIADHERGLVQLLAIKHQRQLEFDPGRSHSGRND
ncbi:MAG TPA: hypothetical protein VGI11_16615 [Variovorax sp.]